MAAGQFVPIASGDMVASLASGQVNEYTPAGTLVQTLIPSANTPTGSAFDGAGNFYVTEFGSNDILKVDAKTGAVSVFSNNTILADGTSFNSPESIAFGPGYTSMFVSDANRNGPNGGIHVIDTATGKGHAFLPLPSSNGSSGLGESDWLAFNHSGTLFMTNENPTQGVMQVNQTTGDIIQPSFVANLPDDAYAISFDTNDNLWVSVTSSILEYDRTGRLLRTISNPAFSTVFAAVFNPPFNAVYAGDLSTGNIFTYDLNGKLLSQFNAGSGIDGLSVAGTVLVSKAGDYVAMGDSYSSGEGTGDYLKGTDVSGDRCHRSLHAYGPLLDDSLGLGALKFVACSGAVTEDFFYRNHSNVTEQAQNASLNSSTAHVTLTIGGNDVGFGDVLTACVGGKYSDLGYGCMKNRHLVADVEARINALGGEGSATSPEKSVRPCASGSRCRTQKTKVYSIKSLLERIHQDAPAADIAVAGYPRLFGTDQKYYYNKKYKGKIVSVCDVGAAPLQRTVDFNDAQWMNYEQGKLNKALNDSVIAAKASGVPVNFIDPTNTFGTHAFCGATANWFNKLSMQGFGVVWPGSFHPTLEGQLGYEQAISGLPLF